MKEGEGKSGREVEGAVLKFQVKWAAEGILLVLWAAKSRLKGTSSVGAADRFLSAANPTPGTLPARGFEAAVEGKRSAPRENFRGDCEGVFARVPAVRARARRSLCENISRDFRREKRRRKSPIRHDFALPFSPTALHLSPG